MAVKIKITQVKSGIGRPEQQRDTLRGLGLGRLHKSSVLEDSQAIRGMIRKVSHLVTIEPAE
jgi:large subunit ribosomal protein L30